LTDGAGEATAGTVFSFALLDFSFFDLEAAGDLAWVHLATAAGSTGLSSSSKENASGDVTDGVTAAVGSLVAFRLGILIKFD
jgi:hypothetical protein